MKIQQSLYINKMARADIFNLQTRCIVRQYRKRFVFASLAHSCGGAEMRTRKTSDSCENKEAEQCIKRETQRILYKELPEAERFIHNSAPVGMRR